MQICEDGYAGSRPVEEVEDDTGGSFSWHHRTIRHIDSRFPDEEPYETAHEFTFTGKQGRNTTQYDSFSFSIAIAMSKEEAQRIADAYDYPPVIEVDEADFEAEETSFGHFPSYRKYKWLDRNVKQGE
jgi:hypothetical protein